MKKEFTTHELLTMPIDEAFKWFHDKIVGLETQVEELKVSKKTTKKNNSKQ